MSGAVATPAIVAFAVVTGIAGFMFVSSYEQFSYFIVVAGFLVAALGIYKDKG